MKLNKMSVQFWHLYSLVQPTWVLPVQQPQTVLAAVTALPSPAKPANCDWTEHTSPEGYKYYYNNATGESKVSATSLFGCHLSPERKKVLEKISPLHCPSIFSSSEHLEEGHQS